MALAGRKVAEGIHSPLTLLLCLIVLTVAVDSQGAANDTALYDWTLAWADADVEDGSDGTNSRTPYDHPAWCGRLCIVVFQSHSTMGRSAPARQAERTPSRVRPRGPPCSCEPSDATSHLPLIFPGARSPRFLHTYSDSSLIGPPKGQSAGRIRPHWPATISTGQHDFRALNGRATALANLTRCQEEDLAVPTDEIIAKTIAVFTRSTRTTSS
jgi:hypothetical protein